MAKAKKQIKPMNFQLEVFPRVFCIRCGSRTGTGFSLDIDGRQYLLTATHVLMGLQEGKVLELFHGGKWKPLETRVIATAPPQIDMTILALNFRITLPEIQLPPLRRSCQVGEEVLCLGFPLGDWKHVEGAETPFPPPFLKRGIVAYASDPSSAVKTIFIDTVPNLGFSGGPVLCREGETGTWQVGALMSALEYDHQPIYFGDSRVLVRPNSGQEDMLVAYEINQALDLINLNPGGFELMKS